MTHISFLASILVACLFATSTYSYSTGPPSAACRTNSKANRNIHMKPGHSGIQLEKEAPKAKITVESQGNSLKITVSSPESFKGDSKR